MNPYFVDFAQRIKPHPKHHWGIVGMSSFPYMFRVYIDELESFFRSISNLGTCASFSRLSILLFVEDVVLLSSTLEDLHRHLDALSSFCNLRHLVFNLGKTKVMTFKGSKNVILEYQFYFQGVEIEITIASTYLGVQFWGPRFAFSAFTTIFRAFCPR